MVIQPKIEKEITDGRFECTVSWYSADEWYHSSSDMSVIFKIFSQSTTWHQMMIYSSKVSSTENEYIDLNIILRDENLGIMDQFLTNGTRSIPILIILDAKTLEVLNRWGPRPLELQKIVMDAKFNAINNPGESKGIWAEAKKKAQLWYSKDKSKTIQEEILNIM